MKSFKTLSFTLGIVVLGSSLVAGPQSNALRNDSRVAVPTNMERAVALAITQRITSENDSAQQEMPESSLSDIAKTLTFEAGIPLLLRQNSYTQLALYPYLWWYKGAHIATEELMVDGIKWLTSYITGRQKLIDCSQSGKGCKVSKFATTVALDRALRSYIVKPCTDKIFGQKQK